MANNKFRKAGEKPGIAETTERIIVKSRGVFFVVIGALLAAALIIGITNFITTKNRSRGLEAVEDIAFQVVSVSENAVTEADEAAKKGKIDAAVTQALSDLEAWTDRKGVIGVRANMLKADLLYRDKKYHEASSAWVLAAEADAKAYTAPICYLNAAVAAEESGDAVTAGLYYEKASSYEDYPMHTQSLFNLGRVKDETGDFTGAAEVYRKLIDGHADDSWADLAKSRLLQLQTGGKIE